ncbi:unnamed protein product [Linum trigynum]|uniref:Uncharacterized protein n=1 Tax=Linum trigynum TaxID=586398 RepID=A0AAV2CNN7_9ROSI
MRGWVGHQSVLKQMLSGGFDTGILVMSFAVGQHLLLESVEYFWDLDIEWVVGVFNRLRLLESIWEYQHRFEVLKVALLRLYPTLPEAYFIKGFLRGLPGDIQASIGKEVPATNTSPSIPYSSLGRGCHQGLQRAEAISD